MSRTIDAQSGAMRPTRAYSVLFADHLADIAADLPLYKSVKQAVDLCDSALRNVKNRVDISDKLSEYEKQLNDISYIPKMSEDEINHFKSLMESVSSLTEERSSLMDRLAKFDRSLPILGKVGNQAEKAIPEMHEAEDYQRALKHDISILEGEKEGLRFERDQLKIGFEFISKFSVGLALMLTFTAVLLGFVSAAYERDVSLYSASLVFLAVITAVVMYVFRKRITMELTLNKKKHQKAIDILNQKNVVFAFYSNFLSHCYDKYHVRSASMLQSNLQEYEEYTKVTTRIDNLRRIMYEVQREIDDFMAQKQIDPLQFSPESFTKDNGIDDQKRLYDELVVAKEKAEEQMSELEERHEAIWDLLTRLKEDRPDMREEVEGVIQTYLTEVERVIVS